MVRRKEYSPASVEKMAFTIMRNVAGSMGGLIGLDRDTQLDLLKYGQTKATYWNAKFSLYHNLRLQVVSILKGTDVDKIYYGLVMALAQRIAKFFAHYPDDVADNYSSEARRQLGDIVGAANADDIYELARKTGIQLRALYGIQGA